MQDVVIVAATRTAIAALPGSSPTIPAHELGATVIRALLEKTGIDPASVDEVILGQVLTAGLRPEIPPVRRLSTVACLLGAGPESEQGLWLRAQGAAPGCSGDSAAATPRSL